VVAAADRCGLVGCVEQGVDLGPCEERDQRLVGAFGWDGQDSSDEIGMFGMSDGGVFEQGMDGGEAGVAGSCGDASMVLEVVEERSDRGGVEILDS